MNTVEQISPPITTDPSPRYISLPAPGKSTSGSIDLVRENSKYTGALDPMVVDNDSPWSGGHISVALPDVAGVFFCNKQVEIPAAGVRSMQLAPTMLLQAGAEIPAEMDLEPLVIK